MTLSRKTKQAIAQASGGGTSASISQAFRLSGVLANPDALDQLIDWKLSSPAIERANGIMNGDKIDQWKKDRTMQLTWTIELRCDFRDGEAEGKCEAITKQVQAAARMLKGTAGLISDKTPPRIAIFSDDVFAGSKEIGLFENTVAAGQEQLAQISGGATESEDPISQELLDALKP